MDPTAEVLYSYLKVEDGFPKFKTLCTSGQADCRMKGEANLRGSMARMLTTNKFPSRGPSHCGAASQKTASSQFSGTATAEVSGLHSEGTRSQWAKSMWHICFIDEPSLEAT